MCAILENGTKDIKKDMFRERFPEIKEIKEHEPKEVQRLELDPEKGMDIVIREREGEKLQMKGSRGKPYECLPAQVIIEKDGEIIEDLGERVSDGIYFLKNKYYFWASPKLDKEDGYPQKKDFVIIPAKWRDSEDILKAVHEIGHSRHLSKNPELLEKHKKIDIHKLIKRMGTSKFNMSRYRNECRECFESEIQIERGAWAEGLRLARELKRDKGIDLLKPFREKKTDKLNWKKVNKYVDQIALGSYEEGLRIFTRAGFVSEDLGKMFSKKYKENFKNKIKIFFGKTMLKLM